MQDKVVLVTGGGSGFGRATAAALATQGARIVIGDLNAESAEETARLATKLSPEDTLRRAAALETLRDQLRNTGIRESLAIEVSFLRAFAA